MKRSVLTAVLLSCTLLVAFLLTSNIAHSQVNLWTWVSGDSTISPAVYGTKGVPSTSNRPGNTGASNNFTDTLGNLYLFGTSYDGPNLWRYNPSTNEWTWLHGDTTLPHHYQGVFGTQGIPNPANTPGELINAATWDDAINNNLWLFGGYNGGGGVNDLWKYDLATNQWTWVKGDNTPNKYGVYGTKGVASLSNKPGGRVLPVTWIDTLGNLWLVGGGGCAASGSPNSYLNDVWKFETATGKWAWMAGDSSANMPTVYGTLGVASPANNPGRFSKSVSWNDNSGNIWLLSDVDKGGFGMISNALWKFNTTSLLWTWMGGDTTGNGLGNYGQLGISSPSNKPMPRGNAYCWTDAAGDFWLFGGNAYALQQNDLWKYNTTTNEWVWLNGKPSLGSWDWVSAYFGRKGVPYMLNYPGSRAQGAYWKDKAGNFWLYGGTTQSSPISQGIGCDLWKLKPSDFNILKFNMFIDTNYNGIHEASEPYMRNATAVISSGASSFAAVSSTGIYNVYVDTGTYATTPVLSLPYYNAIPTSYTSTHNTYFNADSFSFALQPIPGYKDVSIFVIPLSRARPGRPMSYKIVCYNPGTSTVSGTFNFIKDSKLLYDSASATPLSISGDTLIWSYSNLKPLESKSVIAYLKVKTPPAANIFDTLYCYANVAILPGESITADNSAPVIQTIIASYDPNDKTENHGGKISLSKALGGEYLTYTIRFQNTGNDTAFDIFVRDTLSSKLNWNTLEMISASANYQMTINNGKCEWAFRNIHLVDSNKNEPLSHGYLTYRIKAKPNVQVGDVIKNSASIYFDYNLPIKTNTEMTKVVAETFPLKLLSFTAKKQEKINLLNWATTQEINVDHFDIERSNNGRDFNKIGITKANSTNQINTYQYSDAVAPNSPLWGAGGLYYRLKMIDRDGQFSYSPIRQITINNSSLIITLFPNPAKDNLQIQIESDKKTAIQLVMLSADGKVLLSKSIIANEGSSLQSINISTLPKGSYLLKVKSDKDEQVMKFEKL